MAVFNRMKGRAEQRREAQEAEHLSMRISTLNQNITATKEVVRQIHQELRTSFTPEGAITRIGLETQRIKLGVKRAEETKPEDTAAQISAQGEWDQVNALLHLEATTTKELLTAKQKIIDMENEISSLVEQSQPKE